MIVVEKYKLAYCHIPKTGGSAITAALGPHVDGAPPVPETDGRFWQYRYHVRHRADRKQHMHTTVWNTEVDLSRYFVVATVRNPWTWVACMYNSQHGRERKWDVTAVAKDPPTPDGLKDFFLKYTHSGRWAYAWCYGSQYDYLHDKGGQFVPDMLLKFESLQVDFDALCDKVGMKRAVLRRRNPSSYNIDPKDLYDAEAREMVGEFFKRDCELFGYEYPW